MNTPSTTTRLALIGATLASGFAAAIGLYWLIQPEANVLYDAPEKSMLAAMAGQSVATAVHTVAAIIGVAAGTAALAGLLSRAAVVVIGIAEVLTFGIVLGSMATLSVAGYLVAMAMPVVGVVLLVQVIRRYPAARWYLGVPVLLALVVGAVLAGDTLAVVAEDLGAGLAREATRLLSILLLLTVGFTWAVAAVTATAGTPGAARATDWVTRHRTVFTVVAACGPLPYALIRLTWLTPWPAFAPDSIDLGTRIWGLTLSSGAWLGIVLTLGLIRPWGEVFPRWMPRVAGRPVPIAAAAVPGGIIAAVVSFTAIPMLYQATAGGLGDVILAAVTFPCWFWGPALAFAVWGYVGHRREESPLGSGASSSTTSTRASRSAIRCRPSVNSPSVSTSSG